MSFAKVLEYEIILYLQKLEEYKKLNLVKVNSVLSAYSEKVLAKRRGLTRYSVEFDKQIANCNSLIKKIEERNAAIAQFVRRNKRKVTPLKQYPNELLRLQSEIDDITKKINEFEGIRDIDLNGYKDFKALQGLSDIFTKRKEKLKREIKQTEEASITEQLEFTAVEQENLRLINFYFSVVKELLVELIKPTEYGSLMSVLALALPGMPFAGECSGFLDNKGFSIVCAKNFDEIVSNNLYSDNDNQILFEKIQDFKHIDYENGGIYCVDESESGFKINKIFSAEFLKDLLVVVQQNENVNLPLLAMIIHQRYLYGKTDSQLMAELSVFKNQYEATPEQMMAMDNQYYKQEALEEQKRQNEWDRQQREFEAEQEAKQRERHYREQLKLQREYEMAEQRRWEEDRRREDEQRKRDEDNRRKEAARREARERQEAYDRERREEQRRKREESDAKYHAMEACRYCAKYVGCPKVGTPNCPTFRHKY